MRGDGCVDGVSKVTVHAQLRRFWVAVDGALHQRTVTVPLGEFRGCVVASVVVLSSHVRDHQRDHFVCARHADEVNDGPLFQVGVCVHLRLARGLHTTPHPHQHCVTLASTG